MVRVRLAVPEDSERLWTWRNDPTTRLQSLSSELVSWHEHQAWFAASLESVDRVMLVGEAEGVPIGTVRFDTRGDGAAVSINLAPESRGRRLSSPLLLAAIEFYEGAVDRPVALIAEIREENVASLALFAGVGFVRASFSEGIWTCVRGPR